jgi:hypothetical protein
MLKSPAKVFYWGKKFKNYFSRIQEKLQCFEEMCKVTVRHITTPIK